MPPKAKTSIYFTPEQKSRRELYKQDRRRYYKDALRLKDREGKGHVPAMLYPGQEALERLRDEIEKFHKEIADSIGEDIRPEPVRIQILKARRGGFSSDIALQMFHYAEHNPGKNCLVVAHMKTNAGNIAQISRRFQQQFPAELAEIKIPLFKESDELEWGMVEDKPWDSRIIIATASSKNFARSYDFSFVHLSECAHYDSPDAIASAKDAAQFAEFIYEESTANGMDPFFYKSWQGAKYFGEVKAHYLKHKTFPPDWNRKYRFFWAWHQDHGYQIPLTPEQKRDILGDLTETEKNGIIHYNWTPEQIEWRRRKIAGDCSEQTQMDPEDYFRQEYPSSPEEAFVTSGSSVFPTLFLSNMELNHVKPNFHGSILGFDSNGAILKKSENDKPDSSTLVIWEQPKEQHQYVIGTKCATGLKHTDYSVAIVFDRTNGNFLREVACYHGQSTGIELGDIASWLGFKYHSAFIIPESSKAATAQRLASNRYPYLYIRRNEEIVGDKGDPLVKFTPGFKATMANRDMILDHAQDAFRKEEISIKSKWAIREHIIFKNEDGTKMAPAGENDDAVIAVALAVYAHRKAAPPVIPIEEEGTKASYNEKALNNQERKIQEAIAKKIRKSERVNRQKIRLRERNAKQRLRDLFR